VSGGEGGDTSGRIPNRRVDAGSTSFEAPGGRRAFTILPAGADTGTGARFCRPDSMSPLHSVWMAMGPWNTSRDPGVAVNILRAGGAEAFCSPRGRRGEEGITMRRADWPGTFQPTCLLVGR